MQIMITENPNCWFMELGSVSGSNFCITKNKSLTVHDFDICCRGCLSLTPSLSNDPLAFYFQLKRN